MNVRDLGFVAIGASIGLLIGSIVVDYIERKPIGEGHVDFVPKSEKKEETAKQEENPGDNASYFSTRSSIDDKTDAYRSLMRYNGYFEQDMAKNAESELAEMESPMDDDEENSGTALITMEEYDQTFPRHDKIDLVYYVGDDVLADEGDVIVPDPENVIGESGVAVINGRSDDLPPVFYVRNYDMSADYEITVDERSYETVVLGIMPEEGKREPRKMRREE